jgi:hypothetical protein
LEEYIRNVKGELKYKSADANDVKEKFIGPHVYLMDKEELFNYDEVSKM